MEKLLTLLGEVLDGVNLQNLLKVERVGTLDGIHKKALNVLLLGGIEFVILFLLITYDYKLCSLHVDLEGTGRIFSVFKCLCANNI